MYRTLISVVILTLFLRFEVSAQRSLGTPSGAEGRGAGKMEPQGGELDSITGGHAVAIGYWNYYPDNLDTFKIAVDTALHQFHTYNPIFKKSVSNTFLGNLGSPYISNIYFDRVKSDFMFSDVYALYAIRPETLPVVNTRTPFTMLSYGTGGPKAYAEETVSFMFSQNIGENLNVGGYYDLLYARERYQNSSVRHRNYGGFASYLAPRYNAFFNVGANSLENFENGGIGNATGWVDAYISDPLSVTDDTGAKQPENYPVRLDAQSLMKRKFISFDHKYNLGVLKEVPTGDSVSTAFVSALNIVHKFDYEADVKQYLSSTGDGSYYDTIYISNKITSDSLRSRHVSNQLGIYLDEDINQYGKFGAGAFIQMDNYRISSTPWHHIADTTLLKSYAATSTATGAVLDSLRYLSVLDYSAYRYNNVSAGATLFKRHGTHFFFDATAKICLSGYNAADWQLKGQLRQVFPKMGNWELSARANFQRETPDYFLQHYYANNFWWDNNFDATFKQQLGGTLKIPAINFEMSLDVDNMQNLVYFDQNALPAQDGSNLAVLALHVKKTFELGQHVVWENDIVYQETSSMTALPLPKLSAYTNLYYRNILFKVLHFEVGVDCRYHTAFLAPGYMPATGRFYNQQDVEVGDYPYMNAYADFFLRRMRFFLMEQHVNYGWPSNDYFSAPHYGYKHRMFKLGLQWTFYD